jgi:hypothetical protein
MSVEIIRGHLREMVNHNAAVGFTDIKPIMLTFCPQQVPYPEEAFVIVPRSSDMVWDHEEKRWRAEGHNYSVTLVIADQIHHWVSLDKAVEIIDAALRGDGDSYTVCVAVYKYAGQVEPLESP